MGGGKVGKFFVKSQIILFVLLMVVNIALGVDSEFKNTLNKVEVTQSSDNSYNVKLYTQNSLPQGAKVIKKSDLSYYILLPETKNSASISSTSSKDIKQVSASTYPYAGSNNNGYTKINISTTKPVTFTVSTKSTSPVKVAETKKEEPVTLAKVSPETPQIVVQKPKSKITEVKVQQPKTKSVSEKEKIAVAPKTQTAPVQKTVKKQESKILPKIAVKNVKNNTKNKAVIPQKEVKKTTVTKQKTNVIAQKPKAGEEIFENETVTVVVAKKPKETTTTTTKTTTTKSQSSEDEQ